MKNKKIIIIILIIILIIVTILGIVINKKSSSKKISSNNNTKVLDLSTVFETENISELDTEQTKDAIVSKKYSVGSNTYKLNAKVKFNDMDGEMIFLRETYNTANIFQTKYRIDTIDSITTQVGRYMQEFEQECTSYMGINPEEKAYSETLYGEDTEEAPIPLEESIFNENRLYSLTYKVDENRGIKEDEIKQDELDSRENISDSRKYDINFYRNGDYLVCEFVRIFE